MKEKVSGHGAEEHHGRFALSDAVLQRRLPELVNATAALLDLGGVRPRSAFRSVEGTRIHHLELGSGTPLVLLHGASGGAANWYRVFGQLRSGGHHILAPDLP